MNEIKDMTLTLLRIGCNKINFQILEMIMASSKEITINEIMKKFNLTSMPANKRINKLVEVGLLKRSWKKIYIQKVDFTAKFIERISMMENLIKDNIKIESKIVWK